MNKKAGLTRQELDVPNSDFSVSSVCSKDATAFSFDDVQSLIVLERTHILSRCTQLPVADTQSEAGTPHSTQGALQ